MTTPTARERRQGSSESGPQRAHSALLTAQGGCRTLLGSFLEFTGAACSGFHAIAREPDRPILARAGRMAHAWRGFFAQAGIPAPLGPLRTDIDVLLHDESALIEALEDYNGLFRAPELPVPLWESLWLSDEKTLFTKESFEVRGWYERFDWEINAVGYEAEDHIGFETAFCGWLFDTASHGQGPGGGRRAASPTLDDVQGFMNGHYLRWAPECLGKLSMVAQTPFWTHLLISAALLAGGLEKET